MKNYKNQMDYDPCKHCPKSLNCPLLQYGVDFRMCHCRLYEKQEEAHWQEAGWKPISTVNLPYYPN